MQPSLPPPVTVTLQGAHIALVTIDRPDARNAANRVVAQRLDAAVAQTEKKATEDFIEGPRAFIKKCATVWKGR